MLCGPLGMEEEEQELVGDIVAKDVDELDRVGRSLTHGVFLPMVDGEDESNGLPDVGDDVEQRQMAE